MTLDYFRDILFDRIRPSFFPSKTKSQPSVAGAIWKGAAGALCKQDRSRACAAVTPCSDATAPPAAILSLRGERKYGERAPFKETRFP